MYHQAKDGILQMIKVGAAEGDDEGFTREFFYNDAGYSRESPLRVVNVLMSRHFEAANGHGEEREWNLNESKNAFRIIRVHCAVFKQALEGAWEKISVAGNAHMINRFFVAKACFIVWTNNKDCITLSEGACECVNKDSFSVLRVRGIGRGKDADFHGAD